MKKTQLKPKGVREQKEEMESVESEERESTEDEENEDEDDVKDNDEGDIDIKEKGGVDDGVKIVEDGIAKLKVEVEKLVAIRGVIGALKDVRADIKIAKSKKTTFCLAITQGGNECHREFPVCDPPSNLCPSSHRCKVSGCKSGMVRVAKAGKTPGDTSGRCAACIANANAKKDT